jgi:threonylcarbamoyladenosine tRNA methylthiotransferase MtaB
MSKEFGEYYLGKETEALMEEAYLEGGRRYFVGHTKEYVKVALETEKNLANTCITGRVEGKVKDGLYLLVEF